MSTRWGVGYGEGGIRTPDRGISPYNGLANRRLQPLGHLSFAVRKLAIHWSMCNPQPPLRLVPRSQALEPRASPQRVPKRIGSEPVGRERAWSRQYEFQLIDRLVSLPQQHVDPREVVQHQRPLHG